MQHYFFLEEGVCLEVLFSYAKHAKSVTYRLYDLGIPNA